MLPNNKLAWRPIEFCKATGIGKTKFYEEVALGRIRIIKAGRVTLITREAALDWLKLCEAESERVEL